MKRFMKAFVLVAAAAMALTSCENEVMDSIQDNDTYTLTFVADAPESTRTSVSIDGEVATFAWSEGDKLAFIQHATGTNIDKTNKKDSSAADLSAGDGTATFTSNFEEIEGANAFEYAAIYPTSNWKSSASFSTVKANLPADQDLTAGSYDPDADLMMSQTITGVGTQNGHGGSLKFQRLAAIGRMNIKGVTAGETIQSVKLTFNEAVLNGDVTLDFTAGSETATYATKGENYVELKGTMTAATETVVYFTCFPGEYSGAYTINVETDKAIYTKSGNATKPLTFTAGNVLGFGATFTAENREEKVTTTWTLVTDASTLAAGDQIIIAAKGYPSAMSTTQNGNNRGKANITKSGNTITTPGSDVQIFTLKAGTKSGTWAFYTGSGYIYAASSSSNNLKTQTTNNANGSWAITIASDGTATVKAQGSNTRNWLRYNSGSALFSCYGSGQMDICLYKLGSNAGSGDSGETTEPETPGEDGETILFSEDFSAITAGDSTSTSGSSSAWSGNSALSVSGSVYQAGGAIRLGTGSKSGSVTTKTALNLTNNFTVSLDLKGWTSVEGTITVTVGSESKTVKPTNNMGAGFKTYTLSFTGSDATAIKISANKRTFVDNIIVSAE